MTAETTLFARRTRDLLAGVCVCALLAGCGGGSENGGEPTDADSTDTQQTTETPAAEPVFRVYEVRGQITDLPPESSELRIWHEEIPDFDGGEGVRGMSEMGMRFWPPMPSASSAPVPDRVPADIDLSGLAVGDKVRVRFEVQHAKDGAGPAIWYALSLTPLDANTELEINPGEAISSAAEPQPVEVERFRFATRAQVLLLPSEANRFTAKHEFVPDFPNPDGSMGMNVMNMPFWPPIVFDSDSIDSSLLPETLDLTGIEVGDKVLITWEYQRDAETGRQLGFYAVFVEELDPATELDL